MKNLFVFIMFLIYTSCIFFINNKLILLVMLIINITLLLFLNISIKKVIRNILVILPFVLFTVLFNMLFIEYIEAIFIGIKLLLVCNITYIYSRTITTLKFAKIISKICTPLKLLKVNLKEIELLVCIALSMTSILKKEIIELKFAFKAKNAELNIKNIKIMLSKFFISTIKRVNEIEESIISKGYVV